MHQTKIKNDEDSLCAVVSVKEHSRLHRSGIIYHPSPKTMTHQLKGRQEEATHVETLFSSHHHAEVYQRKVWLGPLAIAIASSVAIVVVA